MSTSDFSYKPATTNFMKNRPVGAAMIHGNKWTEVRTATTMAIGAFRDYAHAPKKTTFHRRFENGLHEYIYNKF
jgi:hypothetical protein